MAQVILAPETGEDFERILKHLQEQPPDLAEDRIASITAAVGILETSPLIGRPAEHGMRELVIGSASGGYVALYRYVIELDTVFVLAVRAQREAGSRGG